MEKRIENAIDIFLDALNNGTLAKGTCRACAVGNLIAAGMNEVIEYNGFDFYCKGDNHIWNILFQTGYKKQWRYRDGKYGYLLKTNLSLKNAIKNTNFTAGELEQIEYAFEINTKIYFKNYVKHTKEEVRADQIKGLEAVVKVMLSFNNDIKTDVKEAFTNKAELIKI